MPGSRNVIWQSDVDGVQDKYAVVHGEKYDQQAADEAVLQELTKYCLRNAHEKSVNFFFDCPFLKQTGKCTSGFCQERIGVISMMSTDGAARCNRINYIILYSYLSWKI